MSIICPTVLAADSHEFRDQIERVARFAQRLQIDLTDGNFAERESIAFSKVWLPDGCLSDIHLMYKAPQNFLRQIISLKPNMAIVHAESSCDIPKFAAELRQSSIKTGLAVLQKTKIADIAYILPHVQHLLIFSGNLGHFGGKADLKLAKKIKEAKAINANLEIGWDGGINLDNCRQLSDLGVDVLNVGGAIQKAAKPQEAYATMVSTIKHH